MKLTCPNHVCRKVWDYKGKNKFYATCPDCKTSVKLKIEQGANEKDRPKPNTQNGKNNETNKNK